MNDTTSFAIAFGAFWGGIALYVAWLAYKVRSLAR